MIDREKIEEEIRQVAYELYVQSGCIPGRDLDNWLEAERIVYEKYGIFTTESKPKRKRKSSEESRKSPEKTKKKASKRIKSEEKSVSKGRGKRKKA